MTSGTTETGVWNVEPTSPAHIGFWTVVMTTTLVDYPAVPSVTKVLTFDILCPSTPTMTAGVAPLTLAFSYTLGSGS